MSTRTPRIGLDYTDGPGHSAGVGRYARELTAALLRLPNPSVELVLAEFGRGPRPMEGEQLRLEGSDVVASFQRRALRIPRRLVASAGPLAGWWAARDCRLFHRFHSTRPPSLPCPTTLALSGFLEDDGATQRSRQGAQHAAMARAAAGLFVFSRHSAQHAAEELGVDPAKIWRAPVGSDHWERDVTVERSPRASMDILVLGSIRNDRYHARALAAFDVVRDRGHAARLLVVGRPSNAASAFRDALGRSRYQADVRWIEDPIESSLPNCVAGSAVLLHLADREATPVTALEAARMGVSVVASDSIDAYREVLAGDGLFVPLTDTQATADALVVGLERAHSPEARARLTARAAPFTWDACARVHRSAWETMLSAVDAPPGAPA